MNQRKRFSVGQHVFSLELQRAGQLLGVSTSSDSCFVRFTDTGEVHELNEGTLRVASWDEIRRMARSTP